MEYELLTVNTNHSLQPLLQIPKRGKIYSFNEGNYAQWDEPTKAYMDSLKDADKWGGKPYSV